MHIWCQSNKFLEAICYVSQWQYTVTAQKKPQKTKKTFVELIELVGKTRDGFVS